MLTGRLSLKKPMAANAFEIPLRGGGAEPV